MKILLVNKFLFPNGGSETYIFNLGKELVRQGHAVEYFGMEHPGRIVGNHAESYTSPMDFHMEGLQKLLYPFRIIYSTEARKKIRAVLEDFEPDIVHLNNFNFQLTPSVIYEIRSWGEKRGRYLPVVYTAHDYQWVCPNHMMYLPKRDEVCFECRGGNFGACAQNKCIHGSGIKSLLGAMEAELYRRLKTYEKVDLIICPSEFMKRKLETREGLQDKLRVLYNFLEAAGERERPGADEKEDYVLYFGRYTKEKGILTLLEVCKELSEISFVFAGSGEYEKEIADCKNVRNVGFVRGNELRELIRRARFSIFPSQWYENCPFSVMESQSYGTPVIASDIGGVPELLEDKVTGELFRAGDAEDLKNKIQALWNNRDVLKEYTDRCLEKQFLSQEEYAEILTDWYGQLKDMRQGGQVGK